MGAGCMIIRSTIVYKEWIRSRRCTIWFDTVSSTIIRIRWMIVEGCVGGSCSASCGVHDASLCSFEEEGERSKTNFYLTQGWMISRLLI